MALSEKKKWILSYSVAEFFRITPSFLPKKFCTQSLRWVRHTALASALRPPQWVCLRGPGAGSSVEWTWIRARSGPTMWHGGRRSLCALAPCRRRSSCPHFHEIEIGCQLKVPKGRCLGQFGVNLGACLGYSCGVDLGHSWGRCLQEIFKVGYV